MLFTNKRRRRTALVISFIGLMMSLAFWNGSPAIAEQTEALKVEEIDVPLQEVTIRNDTGASPHDLIFFAGHFSAEVSSDNHGRTSGNARLQTPDYTVELVIDGVDVINYLIGGGGPYVILSGRGTIFYNDGRSESFPATVTVSGSTTSTLPDILIWDIPGAPVIEEGLSFEVEGTLKFAEQ